MDYELYSETETVLKQMKALFRLAVLTNALPSRLPEISRTGVGFLFDGIFISNIVGMHKPQKEFYEYALKQLRVQAEEVVYVDDVEAHLHPAAALGMHVLLMDRENKMSSQWFTIVRDLYEVQTFAFNL
jgi:putative hydrolase of the HAD superfamily